MKLKVAGWIYYDEDWPQGTCGWAARYAIIDEIKKHGYLFSGWAHQHGDCCAPILNDGKIYCYSQRGWGSIMAEAHGLTGRMDYARFAFMTDPEKENRPPRDFDEDAFLPELNLNERFELEVEKDIFDSAQKKGEIKLDDLPSLRYMDEGDTLALCCGGQREEFLVVDIERRRDFTEDELFELECEMEDYSDREKSRRAEEKYNSAKIIMIVSLRRSK